MNNASLFSSLGGIASSVGIILIALIGLGFVFARLYKRASKEVSFVRTGLNGEKVVKDGGALVIPLFQEFIPVNMRTLRLEVRRNNENALITKDRMRVDVSSEFYVRVKPDLAAISTAAQTLGQRTMDSAALKELVEGKFVDALRAVAAEMAMEELHEQRVHFVQRVQESVSSDLDKNGLELEAVSLTGLDQTAKEYFNADNAFDAQGLTALTKQIEEKRKERNDIERDTEVAIQTKNLSTEQQTLTIGRDAEFARLEQRREVETRKAEQESQIKAEQANRTREAEQAEIVSQRDIDVSREQAARASRQAEIEKERDIQIANQESQIAVSEKSKAESEAKAQADAKRAEAAKAEEQVVTVREVARAEREKEVRLVKAREDAEELAIGLTVAAQAEKAAAEDRAEAIRIDAQGRADAIKVQADADERRLEVEAEGVRLLNDARNILGSELISLDMKIELIRQLPSIIEKQVKPIESIDGIKIIDVRGLGGHGNGAEKSTNGSSGSLADDMVGAALNYRAQVPILDSLLRELGLDGDAAISTALAGALAKTNQAQASSIQTAEVPDEEPSTPAVAKRPRDSGRQQHDGN